jgi:LuxR family maltose regulon positive regulatory protein
MKGVLGEEPTAGQPTSSRPRDHIATRTTSPIVIRYGLPPPRATVPRPELFDRLDEGARGPLTLVTGPPGAGKTQLLTAWLTARPPVGPVAWLSLEPSDGHPARFWGELLGLLGDASGGDVTGLPDPSGGVNGDFVAALASAVNELSPPALVVLDDFEQLHSQRVSESLDLLLRSSQQGLRVAIASRLDPSLSLQRLRLEGRLTELRSADLALGREQARQLFEMAGVELTTAQIEKLHTRTEGWVGGLSLAALSLRGHPDPDGFVRTFTGDERTVADYLVEEVLHQQPAAMRDFMLRTSVVEDLVPDLADALTGRDDGARSLELLERSNAFLVPLDEHRFRYRYHPMFLELLRSQLKYQMPDAFALEHRRASRWFAAHGLAAKAVRHALAADDVPAATELLSEHWLSLIVRGQAKALADWVDGLAPRIIAGSAELAVAGAGAALTLGDLERAQGYVRLADTRATAVPAKRRARYTLGRCIVSMFDARVRGDFEATRTAAHKVLAAQQLAGAPGDSRAIAHLNLGVAEHWSAQHESGTARLEEALELAQRDSCEYIVLDCLGQLALFKALEGALCEAGEFAHTAIRIAARHGWEENAAAASAHLALTIVHFNRSELDDASTSLERAALATHRSQTRTTHCLTQLFRGLLIARYELADGIRVAHAVRRDIDNWGLPSSLAAMAGFFEAALLADAGEPERSRRALAQGYVVQQAPVECAVVLARIALAAGDPAEALRELHAPSVRDSRAQHPATHIEALALAAVAKNLLHDDQGALDLLEQALNRAQPDGYRLPVLVVGAPLRELLKRRIRAGTAQRALAGELLQLLEDERGTANKDPRRSLLDPLSDREEAVLRYLPTVMSKAEIASEMFVSVNTVKTHTKNIYRKLGVGTRTEAVRRARRLNLV